MSSRKRVALIFGGQSSEHGISCLTASSVLKAIDKDRFEVVGVGITTLLSIQVFLNIAVVTNLIPCTGISLPFFSYGGTALLMQLGEMGIILSISRDIPTKKAR